MRGRGASFIMWPFFEQESVIPYLTELTTDNAPPNVGVLSVPRLMTVSWGLSVSVHSSGGGGREW